MRITNKTKYKDFRFYEKYLKQEAASQIEMAAERACGKMYELTFATFYNCAHGDFSHLTDWKDPTVFQVYWCKRFAKFEVEIANALKQLTIPQTQDEIAASSAMLKLDWGESILIFLQQWFNLHSYKEAEQITMGELLIAKRAQYNQDKFKRKLNDLQLMRIKKRK